ncbi:MAG: hypothetical protein ACREV8_07200, partial [Gammaproteobacteria bacterium]
VLIIPGFNGSAEVHGMWEHALTDEWMGPKMFVDLGSEDLLITCPAARNVDPRSASNLDPSIA